MAAQVIDDGLEDAPYRVESPLVSVVVEAYNHENYIERCLRGIAMQKVDFPIEVLVGEDHSPDSTAEVLKKLAPELPDSFTIILRKENLGAMLNGRDLWRRVQGKYCAFVEGDDFWTDEYKLQRQVDFLENNPEYSAVYAKVYVVGEDSEPNGESYPQCKSPEYTLRDFFYSTMPGHWSTLVCNWQKFYPAYKEYISQKDYANYAGDQRNTFILLTQGKIKCLDTVTGAYRHVTGSGTSYSARFTVDEDFAIREIKHGKSLVAFAQTHGNDEMVHVAKKVYYRLLLKWSVGKVKAARLSDSLAELKQERGSLGYLLGPLQWYGTLGLRKLTGNWVDL